MNKKDAVKLFGSTRALCDAVGIVIDTWYRWPATLNQDQADRVRGAYLRTNEGRDKLLIHTLGAK